MFDQVRAVHTRGRVRAHLLRQATTVAIALTLIAGIGVFISLRAAPDRFRTVSNVAVSAGVPGYAGDPLKIALTPSTQRAALQAAHIAPSENRIGFGARSSSKNRLSLAVTSPSTAESVLVTRHWVAVTTRILKADATRHIIATQHSISIQVRELHDQLRRVDLKLMKIDPLAYHGVLQFDSPNGNLPGTNPHAPPPVPEQGTVAELNLAFLRIQIMSQISHLGESAAAFRFAQVTPATSAQIIHASTSRISHTPRATWVALSGWCVALLLVLIGGVFIYRRRATSAAVNRS
jgi:uncharacterized protein YneF (UPF0154 family)